MQAAIEVTELSRRFGDRLALDRISFGVRTGEVFGVLGPNGAGKTTTVRVLNGLLLPSEGSCRVNGLDPATEGDEVRRHTGVLTEMPSLYERLSAYDNLAFFGELYGVPRETLPGRIEKVLTQLGLWDRAREKAGEFSKGMKQRLAIARAILHDPPVLFLDEPTAGLDPESADQVNRLILSLRREGRTVFLCTHRLNEAERICDRFALYSQGRVLAVGTKQELERRIWQDEEVEVEFLRAVPALPVLPGIVASRTAGTVLTATVRGPEVIPELVRAAVTAGGEVMRVARTVRSLEAIYFALQGAGGGQP